MATLTLDQLVQSVDELPSLPDVALKVLQMADDPGVSAREISRVISADMALAARLLRIANSAYYGITRSVSTINEAVVILGMQAVRSLALAAASYDTLRREYAGYGLRAGELWHHSMATAIAAQIIAGRTRAARNEEAFVAGLLHDVGKVVLNVHVGPQFEVIRALAELDNLPFHVAEKSVLGYDHAEVGARVAEKWNLPEHLCAAIGGHHSLDRGSSAPELAAVINVADGIAHLDAMGLDEGTAPPRYDARALDALQLKEEDVEQIAAEMNSQLERAMSVFAAH
ncbi:MAG: HDOD domain-containing protein [Chthonomonadales bacterium]